MKLKIFDCILSLCVNLIKDRDAWKYTLIDNIIQLKYFFQNVNFINRIKKTAHAYFGRPYFSKFFGGKI